MKFYEIGYATVLAVSLSNIVCVAEESNGGTPTQAEETSNANQGEKESAEISTNAHAEAGSEQRTSGGEEVADAAEGVSFSEAETILWMTDQLKSIEKPVRLNYEFRKGGSLEEGFTDTVQFNITEILPDGMKKADVNFFTGARNHYVPPYDSINGNVLLGIFLEGDVLEMKRLTDGGPRYFRNSIKTAFAEAAEITPIEIDFNGKKVQGKQVRITPYVDDPRTERSEKFLKLKNKIYTFTVSDEIPGYLYQVHTLVPPPEDAGVGAAPLLEEYLKLVSVEEVQSQ